MPAAVILQQAFFQSLPTELRFWPKLFYNFFAMLHVLVKRGTQPAAYSGSAVARGVFLGQNVALYNGMAVVLHCSDTVMGREDLDEAALNGLMEQLNTCVVISSGTSNWTMQKFGTDDDALIYTGKPALTTLAVYDAEHGNGLMNTLYEYLLSGKSVVKRRKRDACTETPYTKSSTNHDSLLLTA